MTESNFDVASSTRPAVRVLIVDDESLMRAGLRLMIDGTDQITVVGEASDGQQALEAVERLQPDVVLMDIRMPVLDGIGATDALVKSQSQARVVILTAFDTDDLLRDALLAGAVSFLLKDAAPRVVIQAVHDAAQDRSTFSPKALSRLVDIATRSAPRRADVATSARQAGADFSHLVTPREWEVGRLIAQGLTNIEIADALFVSTTTVKTHLSSLFAKLHVTNRVQLAIRVLEHEPSIDG